ncbi:Pre-mRNA-splicing factor Cwf15/Cwc15 [Corchorus olitorius]|uniref:Pre-mRNA-splicing factor Cwf15/Cwc15 n=1 Tax=Corchorus olitorius TaxID=93759 RepID=A0A1R3KBH6_9ROSI|nr:Pre-mRNA-splicing factor Cwf15/Cwc15 [Corchorus olitorius]
MTPPSTPSPKAEDHIDADDSDEEIANDTENSDDENANDTENSDEEIANDTESVSDDEDDTEAALAAELERMKKDKAEGKQEQEEQLKAEESQLLKGNPLLNNNNTTSFGVKRRWDDDVPFKNQARGETKLQKRSINDTMRNDFAKKFLQRHMK